MVRKNDSTGKAEKLASFREIFCKQKRFDKIFKFSNPRILFEFVNKFD